MKTIIATIVMLGISTSCAYAIDPKYDGDVPQLERSADSCDPYNIVMGAANAVGCIVQTFGNPGSTSTTPQRPNADTSGPSQDQEKREVFP